MTQTYGRYVVDQSGPPEVMRWTQEPVRHAGSNEIRIRHETIGVDFIDTQIRAGQMPATLPTGLGFAAVGFAEEVAQVSPTSRRASASRTCTSPQAAMVRSASFRRRG